LMFLSFLSSWLLYFSVEHKKNDVIVAEDYDYNDS
jgi:hypothetical protein